MNIGDWTVFSNFDGSLDVREEFADGSSRVICKVELRERDKDIINACLIAYAPKLMGLAMQTIAVVCEKMVDNDSLNEEILGEISFMGVCSKQVMQSLKRDIESRTNLKRLH